MTVLVLFLDRTNLRFWPCKTWLNKEKQELCYSLEKELGMTLLRTNSKEGSLDPQKYYCSIDQDYGVVVFRPAGLTKGSEIMEKTTAIFKRHEAEVLKRKQKLVDMINAAKWKKTDYISPHEYILEKNEPELHAALSELIDNYGYPRMFQGKEYTCYNILEYRYWHMEEVINRAINAKEKRKNSPG